MMTDDSEDVDPLARAWEQEKTVRHEVSFLRAVADAAVDVRRLNHFTNTWEAGRRRQDERAAHG